VPLLNKVKETEGWLSENEADLLLSVTLKSCTGLPPPHHIVEIGSYKGKSTVLLGSVVKAYFPSAKVYAIDPHEGMVGAADEGIQSIGPSLESFRRNIADAGIADAVELIRDYSYQVAWERPITLLFIDGLHDYFNVARDFWHFADYIVDGGYVAFHDYADYYPGVMAFVDELLAMDIYREVHLESSMMVVQKLPKSTTE
jgi:predicted O-methyltransferase YrrM